MKYIYLDSNLDDCLADECCNTEFNKEIYDLIIKSLKKIKGVYTNSITGIFNDKNFNMVQIKEIINTDNKLLYKIFPFLRKNYCFYRVDNLHYLINDKLVELRYLQNGKYLFLFDDKILFEKILEYYTTKTIQICDDNDFEVYHNLVQDLTDDEYLLTSFDEGISTTIFCKEKLLNMLDI